MEPEVPAPLICLRNIVHEYGTGDARVPALQGIDFSLSGGEVAALSGPSGSGKSTLLNIIGCILEPTQGWMEIDREIIADDGWKRRDYRSLRLTKIGFIFQFHNLLPFLTGIENVAFASRLAGVDKKTAYMRAHDLMQYLEVAHRLNSYPSDLSGGEAQRIAIARALINAPRIILADEPTAALDSARTVKVVELLRKVAYEQKTAVIIVSHDENVVKRVDKVFGMNAGRLETGTADDLYYSRFRRLRRRTAESSSAKSYAGGVHTPQ
jgi:putative ABC transport system ATP-binding protein